MSNSMLVGVPLLFISLNFRIRMGFNDIRWIIVFDIKIVGSFIITVVYLIILLLHRSGKLIGTTLCMGTNLCIFINGH